MSSTPPSADAQGYLENLMRAGQDAMKQFDDVLISTMGVSRKASSANQSFPFALVADLQREYFKQLWQFWNAVFLRSFADGAHSEVALAKGAGGLSKASKAQAQQVRTISRERVAGKRIGALPPDDMAKVEAALRLHLSL